MTSEGSLTARTGRLLVATPALLDPTFKRTVVLLCAYEQEGTFGVVLNRPLESDVLDHLPAWRHVAASPAVIFEGGPVGLDGALGVGRIGATPPAEGWTGVAGSVGLLDLERTPEELDGTVEQLRVFSGHAGWGAGQLDAEISEGSWFVVDSAPGDPFTREPARLWREVLRRQPGRLAIFADYPVDPSVN